MAYIAGPFTATWDPVSEGGQGDLVGQVKDGFNIQYFANKQLITGDNEGLTPQDAVNLGYECFVEFTMQDWNLTDTSAGHRAGHQVFWPQGAVDDPPFGENFNNSSTYGIGTLDSSLWKTLVLTANSGSPADITLEDTYTFPRVTLAENFPVDILLNSRLREIFLRLRAYPGSSFQFFTVS